MAKEFVLDTGLSIVDPYSVIIASRLVNLIGVSIAPAGESHPRLAAHQVRQLSALAGKGDLSVGVGSAENVSGKVRFPLLLKPVIGGMLWNLLRNTPTTGQKPGIAVEMLSSVIRQAREKVTIIATGPVTNLADLLQFDPTISEKIEQVFCMAGAIDVPGNSDDFKFPKPKNSTPTVELNAQVDPVSLDTVLQRLPVTLVPLDATNPITLTDALVKELTVHPESHRELFIARFTQTLSGLARRAGQDLPLWDPTTVLVAIFPELLGSFEQMTIKVNTDQNSPDYGQTTRDKAGVKVRVCTSVNSGEFYRVMVQTLRD